MSVELFMYILFAISVVTGLTVEAIKMVYITNVYNVIAGVISLVLTICVAIGYKLWFDVPVDVKYIIFFLCIAFASWLSAMLGFDKVKQALLQIGGR